MNKIRILKTIPVKNGLTNWGDTNRRLIAAVASDSCEYDFWDLSDTSIEKIVTEYENTQVATSHIELAQKAENAGFDAVAMGCLMEPGLDGAKEVISIPVVGALECCVYLAAVLADRFSLIIGNPASGPALRSRIRRMGLESRLASIRAIESSPLEFAAEADTLPDRMLAVAKIAVEQDGAGSIISYGGLNVLYHLRAALPVPVLNPQQCQVLMAEILQRVLAQGMS
jgi:allantoin racemase